MFITHFIISTKSLMCIVGMKLFPFPLIGKYSTPPSQAFLK